jgi:uncharacterized membrane protein YecN with MAPEG domain
MDNGDLFYVFGIVLAVSAVLTSFVGLRSEKFPGRAAPIVALWFVLLIGATTTFSVMHAQDEEKHEEAALQKATEEAELEEAQ